MIEVTAKIDEVINIIDNSELIIKLKQLNKKMKENNELIQLFELFNKAKEEYQTKAVITPSFIKLKEQLYKHSLVAEYRSIISQLNRSFLKFNKEIKALIDDDSTCSKI